MLGITKLSTGRMGNRLFHYHFLRQVSAQTGMDYFNIRFPEAVYFEELKKKKRPFSFFRKQIKISSSEIKELGPEQLLKFLQEKNSLGYDIIFKPPVLGEAFFDYLFNSPNDFLKIKPEYQQRCEFKLKNCLIIGLHFRGTDFKVWNPQASLEFPYYREAINYCRNFYKGQPLAFALFTDDFKFPAFQETIFFLKSLKQEFQIGDNRRPPIIDFYQMSQCDVLVSSPSTFAVLAGCLGKPKKIIHCQAWLDYSLSKNDKFWVDLSQTTNPYYSLWKTF